MKAEKDVIDFESELKDRFGSPPEEVMNLLDIMRLKILARELLVIKVHEAQGKVLVTFAPDTTVQPQHLFKLQKKRKNKFKFLPEGFEIVTKGLQWKKVFEEIYGVIQELKKEVSAKTDPEDVK